MKTLSILLFVLTAFFAVAQEPLEHDSIQKYIDDNIIPNNSGLVEVDHERDMFNSLNQSLGSVKFDSSRTYTADVSIAMHNDTLYLCKGSGSGPFALSNWEIYNDEEKVKATASDPTSGYLEDKVANSIIISSNTLQLSGDEASPGNNQYYGTDGGGSKGYYDFSASLDEKVKASAGDGTAGYLDAKVANSIIVSSNTLQLSGDAASPGNTKYYGTDGGGTKGYYSIPNSSGETVLGSQGYEFTLDGDLTDENEIFVTEATLQSDLGFTGSIKNFNFHATVFTKVSGNYFELREHNDADGANDYFIKIGNSVYSGQAGFYFTYSNAAPNTFKVVITVTNNQGSTPTPF